MIKGLLLKIQNIPSVYIVTFLFLLTFFCYFNTLGNSLFFDDEDFIYNNAYVQNFSLDKYFSENVIAGAGKVSNYYRPFLLLSYGIETKLFGGFPFIYHLDNILLQAVAGILLFLVFKRLTNNQFVSLFSAALFIVHPIQTEAVSYASGRSDPMGALFVFATLFCYVS